MTRIKIHISNVKLPFYPPCEVKCGLQNRVSTLGLKQSNLPQFTITLKDAEDTQAMIQLVKISLNPKWRRIALKNLQFTLSYAF